MQVNYQRPPVAPKPRSAVQPVQYPLHQPQYEHQHQHQHHHQQQQQENVSYHTESSYCSPRLKGGEGRRPIPKVRACNIPPPPASPPPPLPAPRIASLQRRPDCSQGSASNSSMENSRPVSSNDWHMEQAEQDDLHYKYSIVQKAAPPPQPPPPLPKECKPYDAPIPKPVPGPETAGIDPYVAFIPPGTGTLKRRLCRTMSRMPKAGNQLNNTLGGTQHNSAQDEVNKTSGTLPRPENRSYQEPYQAVVTEQAQSGINSVVQPSVLNGSNPSKEKKSKSPSVQQTPKQNSPPESTKHRSSPHGHHPHSRDNFPIHDITSEPRPRSMSTTSTWKRTQPAANFPPSGSMSVRVKPTAHHGHISSHSPALPRHPVYSEEPVYDDVEPIPLGVFIEDRPPLPLPPPEILAPSANNEPAAAEYDSPANCHCRARTPQCPSEDSGYECISPRGSFIEHMIKNDDLRHSLLGEGLDGNTTELQTPTAGLNATQAQFFNAWESYLRSTNPSGDDSSSESDMGDDQEQEDDDAGETSGDEGSVQDIYVSDHCHSNTMPARSCMVANCTPQLPDDSQKLARSNAIRRGPRSSGRSELKVHLPTDLTPSMPSLVSDSSKEVS